MAFLAFGFLLSPQYRRSFVEWEIHRRTRALNRSLSPSQRSAFAAQKDAAFSAGAICSQHENANQPVSLESMMSSMCGTSTSWLRTTSLHDEDSEESRKKLRSAFWSRVRSISHKIGRSYTAKCMFTQRTIWTTDQNKTCISGQNVSQLQLLKQSELETANPTLFHTH